MWSHHPRLSGILTGLAVTVVGMLWFFGIGGENDAELYLFDRRVRNCSPMEPTTPIVHVDIDDNALDRVGRWPWGRDQLADIIRTLDRLDASVIAVDLLLSEPEAPRIDDPRYSRDSDVEPRVEIQGAVSDRNVVFGDLELADAIRTAGNVYLPVQFGIRLPNEAPPLAERLAEIRKADRLLTVTQAIDGLRLPDNEATRRTVARELLRIQAADLLRGQFTLTDEQVAAALRADLSAVSGVIAGVKADVSAESVAALFVSAEPSLDEVLKAVLGDRSNLQNADRADVVAAYRRQRGLKALLALTFRPDPALAATCARATKVSTPHFLMANEARQIGAVTFRADSDGATRRIPLITSYRGRAVKHLGFAVACDVLGLDAEHITLAADRVLSIPRRDGAAPYEVPLDAQGNLIIDWTRTAKDWRAGKDFPHISAAKLWAVVDAEREMKRNQVALAYLYADVVREVKGDYEVAGADGSAPTTIPGDHAYRARVNEYLELEQRAHLAALRHEWPQPRLEQVRQQLATQGAQIRQDQQTAVSFVRRTCKELDEIPADEIEKDPQLKKDALRFRSARERIDTDIAARLAANERLEALRQTLLQELAPSISGKYVFLGFAATAEGDIVKTPVDPLTIGVMCHAQVLNSFLQNRFITRADRRVELLLCLALGAIVSAVTALRGPRLALLTTIAVLVAYTAVNAYIVFMRENIWLAQAGILATVAGTWAFVTLFRQLTAERERRIFAKQLSQYTSPAIAARIAENPEAAQAFKTVQTRDMTLFFSDLAGFTSITEQENPAVVQHVLNQYLEQMTQAIWSRGGLVSKFMGDGIMAFFNSSVDPLPDHPVVSCESSLLAFAALERLKAERKHDPASPIFDRLSMRVGLASGPCKNGDFGSAIKADYTAMGDVVNLAARLEPANKVFGTRILVAGPTWEVARGQFVFRYVAELQVKGKANTVPVYELVCRKGELTDEQRQYIERFEAGVALYKQRKWDECIVHFTRLLARKFDDLGASRYIDACQELKAFPPEDDWGGALELKEK